MKYNVTADETGSTLLAFIKNKLGPDYSNRAIKRTIESNQCRVNGRIERHASTILGTGDSVEFVIEKETHAPLQRIFHVEQARILYEDQDLLIYNKPAGLPCEPEPIRRLLEDYSSTARLVHRLDRDTTGVLIFAKQEKAWHAMVELFRQREIDKTYFAMVDGVPLEKSGVIENYLGKIHTYHGQTVWGAVDKKLGLYAYTEWYCEKSMNDISLFRCKPTTGRTHQLRVHLSGIGHPILGDYQYCQHFRSAYRPSRCLLHAAEVTFISPGSSHRLNICAPLPKDFELGSQA